MKRSTLNNWIAVATIAAATLAGTVSSATAHGRDVVVSGQAGVRVWVDGGDVFRDYDDVSIYVRTDRDCYATLLLVDTEGYVHVLYPSSPYERAWFRGGRTYRYDAWDLGLDRLHGAGIAHVFAVSSPEPFDYSYYGASVFVGGFGFRVYGDPYIACRDFYVSLLPASCHWDYVGVGSARFYVRRWVRYPSYLCFGGPELHVRIGDSCRNCSSVYVSYRANVASPYEVMRPAPRFKRTYGSGHAETSVGRVEAVRSPRVKTFAREDAGARVHKDDRGYQDARGYKDQRGRDDARGYKDERGRDDARGYKDERGRDDAFDRGARESWQERSVSPARPVKVVSTSRSGESARATVKVSNRSVKAAPAVKRGGGTAVRTRADARGSETASRQQKGTTRKVRQADK